MLPNSSSLNGATTSLVNLLPRFPQFPVGDGSGGWSGSSGVLEQQSDQGRSYYGSLNVRLERRLAQGLSAIANYGWSRLTEADTWLNDGDPQLERRISPFDHPQRIVTAITYILPVGRGQMLNVHSRALDAVVGGWQINSVYLYQLGQPLNWDNGSTTSPGDYVYYGGPGALSASLNNRQANTTTAGVALPAFSTLFATSSANVFISHPDLLDHHVSERSPGRDQ